MRIGLDTKPLILHTAYTLAQKQIHFYSHLCANANRTERERNKKSYYRTSLARTHNNFSFIYTSTLLCYEIALSLAVVLLFIHFLFDVLSSVVAAQNIKQTRKPFASPAAAPLNFREMFLLMRYQYILRRWKATAAWYRFPHQIRRWASERPTDCAWSEWAGSKARQKDNEQ